MSAVEEFIKSPSEDLLSACTKDQLEKIAEHFSITLTSEDKKRKELLLKAVGLGLVVKNILPAREGIVSPVLSSASNASDRELKIREYSFEERKLQLEAARIRAERENRVVKEKELDKELEIKKLEIQHELDLKRLEHEAAENERQREHERDERNFLLKKLELELEDKRLTIAQPVPSVPSRDLSRSPVHSPVHSPVCPSALGLGLLSAHVGSGSAAPMGEIDTAPLHSAPLNTSDASDVHAPAPAPIRHPDYVLPFAPGFPLPLPPAQPFDDEKHQPAHYALVTLLAGLQPGDKADWRS
ncbi:uncharacterized protein LOC121679629 isoform X3 [Alosa sapidissima]|uniref:uncharacterized protein LOC121679629 isoform X3 n=1 Tax=Alosa sapidissima TaxID=34773 RepID=UPI001C0A5B71|nr:uncharacterized protein LOC121679629 isoform X3 [Alosa sapidissima]